MKEENKEDKNISDFLGNPILIGDRVIIATRLSGGNFRLGKVTKITLNNKKYKKTIVGILIDGNKKNGYTFPDRLIVLKQIQ